MTLTGPQWAEDLSSCLSLPCSQGRVTISLGIPLFNRFLNLIVHHQLPIFKNIQSKDKSHGTGLKIPQNAKKKKVGSTDLRSSSMLKCTLSLFLLCGSREQTGRPACKQYLLHSTTRGRRDTSTELELSLLHRFRWLPLQNHERIPFHAQICPSLSNSI